MIEPGSFLFPGCCEFIESEIGVSGTESASLISRSAERLLNYTILNYRFPEIEFHKEARRR